MNPSIWGESAWLLIHSTALNLPVSPSSETKKNYKNFYYSLQYTLPCDNCKRHYSQIIQENPIDEYLISRDHLFYWTWRIHTLVNSNTNSVNASYSSTIRKYNRLYNINISQVVSDSRDNEQKYNDQLQQYYQQQNYGYGVRSYY